VKKGLEGRIAYFDTYRRVARNSTGSTRTSAQSNTPEQYLFEYALFHLTAAHGIINEPKVYGAIRLVDAVSKLSGLYSTTNALKPDPFLVEAKKKIDAELNTAITSEEEFMKFIDGLIDQFACEPKKRYGKEAPS